jgi:hypothetical protein
MVGIVSMDEGEEGQEEGEEKPKEKENALRSKYFCTTSIKTTIQSTSIDSGLRRHLSTTISPYPWPRGKILASS